MLIAAFAALAAIQAGAATVPDFTFLQVSDLHAPMAQSRETLTRLPGPDVVELSAFGTTCPKPSFVLATGDLTEFGGGSGWFAEYQSYFKDSGLPVYNVLGNHDNTWHAGIRDLRNLGTGPYYSFDRNGCHFVALMSATTQDPRPSFGEEQIAWLAEDLKKVGPNTPVFLFFHHPVGGSEFASLYDRDRLLDTLRASNVVLMMTGHSHGSRYDDVAGIDQIQGGSTFGGNAGITFVSVKDNTLRVAYQRHADPNPSQKVFEKPLQEASLYPNVRLLSPRHRQTITKPQMSIKASLLPAPSAKKLPPIQKASFTVDGEVNGDLTITADSGGYDAEGQVQLAGLLPGSHYLRVTFTAEGREFTRSCQFYLDAPGSRTGWRKYIAASSKAAPAVAEGRVYIADNAGYLRALETSRGNELWSVQTGAEILAEPLVAGDRVIAANGLGKVLAFSTAGKKLWEFTAGDAVYSSPVLADGKVVFGCNDGKLYALDAATGAKLWTNEDGEYSIESKPFVSNGKVYYGCWDQYVRCVNLSDGSLVWKVLGEGPRVEKAAKRYYSPGDAMPVVVDNKVFAADRSYRMIILDAATGERINALSGVAAAGPSADGKSVYLRKTTGDLVKINSQGEAIWSAPAELNAIPTAPAEKDGVVFVASARGKVSAVNAADGKILWQYQASPQLFVMSSVASDGKNAYVTAFDGTVSAIKVP